MSSDQTMKPSLIKRLTGGGGKSNGYRPTEIHDARSAIILGNAIIFGGIVLFMVWASTAPLDEGVPAKAVVVLESLRKTVATLNGGTVSTVRVHENQMVAEGEILLTLDDNKPQTAYDLVGQDYVSAWAQLVRLLAEQAGDDTLVFPEDLVKYANQIRTDDLLTAQEQLFRSRRRSFDGEQSILREGVSASTGLVTGLRQQISARQQQLDLIQQQVEAQGPLVEKGYSSKHQFLELQRQQAELRSISSELHSRLARELSTTAELRMRMLQTKQTFIRDVEVSLADVRKQVANLSERVKDAHLDLEKTVIRSPVAGQVASLVPQNAGAVLTPGSKILEIVPENERLLLDVQIPTHIIDKVTKGLKADVRINAFPELPQLIVDGIVESISADRREPKPGEMPYYLARVEITSQSIEKLHGRQLRPGMAADVVIKTGERSLLTYLMTPLTKRLFTAFQEP
jgi:protease secretion system membrane fusion protein